MSVRNLSVVHNKSDFHSGSIQVTIMSGKKKTILKTSKKDLRQRRTEQTDVPGAGARGKTSVSPADPGLGAEVCLVNPSRRSSKKKKKKRSRKSKNIPEDDLGQGGFSEDETEKYMDDIETDLEQEHRSQDGVGIGASSHNADDEKNS